MTAGTIFLMWLGEQIDEYGIGNGISLIIMAGIVARIPDATKTLLFDRRRPASRSRSSRSAAAAAAGDISFEKLLVLIILFVARGRGGHRHHQGAAAHPDAVGQARARPARLRRHPAVPAAARQPGRRHARDLRQQLAACCPFFLFKLLGRARPSWRWASMLRRRLRAAGLHLQPLLHRPDLLLLLLLDGHHLQPEGHGQQPQGLRQLHPRLPPRQAHRRLPGTGHACASPTSGPRSWRSWPSSRA